MIIHFHTPPNALRQSAAGRRSCNRRVSWPRSLSLGPSLRRYTHETSYTHDCWLVYEVTAFLALRTRDSRCGRASEAYPASPSRNTGSGLVRDGPTGSRK